jgi:hypothetical protein
MHRRNTGGAYSSSHALTFARSFARAVSSARLRRSTASSAVAAPASQPEGRAGLACGPLGNAALLRKLRPWLPASMPGFCPCASTEGDRGALQEQVAATAGARRGDAPACCVLPRAAAAQILPPTRTGFPRPVLRSSCSFFSIRSCEPAAATVESRC